MTSWTLNSCFIDNCVLEAGRRDDSSVFILYRPGGGGGGAESRDVILHVHATIAFSRLRCCGKELHLDARTRLIASLLAVGQRFGVLVDKKKEPGDPGSFFRFYVGNVYSCCELVIAQSAST